MTPAQVFQYFQAALDNLFRFRMLQFGSDVLQDAAATVSRVLVQELQQAGRDRVDLNEADIIVRIPEDQQQGRLLRGSFGLVVRADLMYRIAVLQ